MWLKKQYFLSIWLGVLALLLIMNVAGCSTTANPYAKVADANDTATSALLMGLCSPARQPALERTLNAEQLYAVDILCGRVE